MKKTMKFLTALLLANIAVASPSRANTPAHINSTALANLQWQDVSFSEKVTTNLSEQQKQAFTASFAGVESPIAAYRIPANQGTLEVEIISPIENKSAFFPSAVVLDSNFNVAATYPSSKFKFQEERGMQPNRFAAELNLTPAASQSYIYLLIYTTQQDLAKTTMIPHPAKLYAKGTGHQPPALNDIEVKHSLNGQIIVNATNANGTRFIGMPTNIFSSSDKKAVKPVGAAPTPAPTANIVSSKAVNVPVGRDTEAYFNQAITKALKGGDVNKAMNLVNEAEKLGLTSPRQTFLKQVSSK
ncbi:maltose operon protein MalM [Aggregatibacter actinomycetemcomitans]|uniref:maltose operon protein MalM n=1 Tax=Aggregatibacter actinomycetemcomitans TaxID=714 RepID=UPI0011DD1407|nr:maltose operon protein MalM [Aggregatibacter actinomycetemcomitans]QEH45579.1 maltose operon protein MalM [Aggregatibacter actinomycetemcomitans]QEH49489.1 maltose operon protein MalM [Aggregatibacter actinomycetemcomitans]